MEDSSGKGVSFHLPLHRLIGQYLYSIITTWPQLKLSEILAPLGKPKSRDYFNVALLDYTAQIHVRIIVYLHQLTVY